MFKVQKKTKGADIPKTIRFTPELNEELSKISQNANISFNDLVLQCCRYAIEHIESED